MRADARESVAARLRQVAADIGLELDDERLARLLGLLESTVDATRLAAELVAPGTAPAIIPDLDPEPDA
jgi:hypothetical protein